ncbi:MAG: uncharacterized protein K0R38_23 [Polyangiaceae bacterium]|jgi:uncharacterized protein YggE|nr:uncharacterized protein [Polyangiaceae bacterium]
MPFRPAAFAYSACLVALACAALSACAPHGGKTIYTANGPVRGVTVTGNGKANGKPDVARTTIGVETRANTAEEAVSDVNARMARVVTALKQAGVAEADLRTATVSLNFERNPEPPRPLEPTPATAATKAGPAAPPPAPLPPTGFYVATNNVEVTVRDLNRAGQVLSAATSAGANQMYGIRFELEDPSALLATARQKAVADAKARAERLAQLAGVKLGAPVSITELEGGSPGPMPAFAMMRSEAANAAPVERGELTVTTSVQIVYALDH